MGKFSYRTCMLTTAEYCLCSRVQFIDFFLSTFPVVHISHSLFFLCVLVKRLIRWHQGSVATKNIQKCFARFALVLHMTKTRDQRIYVNLRKFYAYALCDKVTDNYKRYEGLGRHLKKKNAPMIVYCLVRRLS